MIRWLTISYVHVKEAAVTPPSSEIPATLLDVKKSPDPSPIQEGAEDSDSPLSVHNAKVHKRRRGSERMHAL